MLGNDVYDCSALSCCLDGEVHKFYCHSENVGLSLSVFENVELCRIQRVGGKQVDEVKRIKTITTNRGDCKHEERSIVII